MFMFLSVGKRIPLFFSSFLLGPPKGEGAAIAWLVRDQDIYWISFSGWGGGHSVLEDSSPTVHPSCPFLLIWDESPKQRWPGPQPRPAEHLPFQKDHLWLGRSIKTGVRSPAGVSESLGLEGGRRKLKVLPQLFNWSCIFHCCFLQGALMNW